MFATPDAFEAPVIVITEAPIDALSLAACGIPAVTLCGTSGPAWLSEATAFRRVALAFDGDDAGDRGAGTLTHQLAAFGATLERQRPVSAKHWNALMVEYGRATLAAALTAQDREMLTMLGPESP